MVIAILVSETDRPLHIGWSGETAKYQRDRLHPSKVRQANRILAIHISHLKVRCTIADSRSRCIVLLLPAGCLPAIHNGFRHQAAFEASSKYRRHLVEQSITKITQHSDVNPIEFLWKHSVVVTTMNFFSRWVVFRAIVRRGWLPTCARQAPFVSHLQLPE